MGIRESLLNTITSVGSSDFVRIVTSAGASSKATLQNVIKSFETGLGAKSSLTDSDYMRLVGSDNNLYKQSMSSVYDAIGVKFLGNFTASSDDDTIKAALTALKTAYSSEASSTTNKPKTIAFFRNGAWGFVGTAWIRNNTLSMTVTQNYNGNTYFGRDDNGTQTVTLMPTRTEINTLNNLSMHSIQGNVSNFDSIPDGVSCGYLLNATGVPEGWYLCLKNTVASNSKELYLLGAGGKAIYTSQYRNSAWSTPSKFPTRAEVDALNKKIYYNHVSTTSYAVPIDGWVYGNYHTFVMYGGTSSTNTFMYLGWIDNTGSTVALTPIKEDNGRTYTATFNASSKILTITPSTTLWGGLTVITGQQV